MLAVLLPLIVVIYVSSAQEVVSRTSSLLQPHRRSGAAQIRSAGGVKFCLVAILYDTHIQLIAIVGRGGGFIHCPLCDSLRLVVGSISIYLL